jgi:hypothetical protein
MSFQRLASAARGTSVRLHAVVRIPHSAHHEGHEEHEGLQNETLDAILELREVEIDHR